MRHTHHIIPKYAGGSDDLDNLVSLTVTQHAMWHFAEWQRKGDERDRLAWLGLAGIIGKEEIVERLTKLSRRFKGKSHSDDSKNQIGQALQEYYAENPEALGARKEQMRKLGKSEHKRNPGPATLKQSGPNKRQYMRKHWRKEVWDAIETAWKTRTSTKWGKISIARSFGVSVKTVENMLKLIKQNVDWHTATEIKL